MPPTRAFQVSVFLVLFLFSPEGLNLFKRKFPKYNAKQTISGGNQKNKKHPTTARIWSIKSMWQISGSCGQREIQTTPGIDVPHAVLSVLLSIRHLLASLDLESQPLDGVHLTATPVRDVNPAVVSVLLALRFSFPPPVIEDQCYRANSVRATLHGLRG